MYRHFIALAALASLTVAAYADNNRPIYWQFDKKPDKMSSGEIITARVRSEEIVEFGFPYNGAQRAELILRRHPRLGDDVILGFNKAHFLCHRDCYVSVRFGDDDAIVMRAGEASDGSNNTLFIEGYNKFIEALRTADRIVIEATFYQEGTRSFTFNTYGFFGDVDLPAPVKIELKDQIPERPRAPEGPKFDRANATTAAPIGLYDDDHKLKATIPASTRIYIGRDFGGGWINAATENDFGYVKSGEVATAITKD